MKKTLMIIAIMLTAFAAFGQNHSSYSSHTYHWGDGTSTTVRTMGNHTYVSNHGPSPLCFYDVYAGDTLCGNIDVEYGISMPEVDSMYAVFVDGKGEIGKIRITKQHGEGYPKHGKCVIEFADGFGPQDFDLIKCTLMVKCSNEGYKIACDLPNMSRREIKKLGLWTFYYGKYDPKSYNDFTYLIITHTHTEHYWEDDDFRLLFHNKK